MSSTITAFTIFAAQTLIKSSEVNDNFGNFRGSMIPIQPSAASAVDDTYDLGTQEYFWRYSYSQQLRLRGGGYFRYNTAGSTIQYSNNSGTTWLGIGDHIEDILPRDNLGALNDSVNDIGQASVGGSNYYNTMFINDIDLKNGGHIYFTTTSSIGSTTTPNMMWSYNSGTTKIPFGVAFGNLVPINPSTGAAQGNLLNLGDSTFYWANLHAKNLNMLGDDSFRGDTAGAGIEYTENGGTNWYRFDDNIIEMNRINNLNITAGSQLIIFNTATGTPTGFTNTGYYVTQTVGSWHCESFTQFLNSSSWAAGNKVFLTFIAGTVSKRCMLNEIAEADATSEQVSVKGSAVFKNVPAGATIAAFIEQDSGATIALQGISSVAWATFRKLPFNNS